MTRSPASPDERRRTSGRLYIVSTPIGNMEDVTMRALRVLGECSLIAAEDTRRTRKLLARYDLHTPLMSYYQQKQFHKAPIILDRLAAGDDVALVTDAGTPGISDPGGVLVAMAVEAGVEVVPVPGPCAAVTLLSAAGLPADRFVFEGFLPARKGRKRRRLEELSGDPRTVLLYESPHRLAKTLALLLEVFGNRPAAVGRELTKAHEEIVRGTLSELAERYSGRKVLGEVTIAVAGC